MAHLTFKTLASISWSYSKDKDPSLKGKTAKYSNVGAGKITYFNENGLPVIKGKEVTWFIDNKNYLYMTRYCVDIFTQLGYILGSSSRNDTVLKYRLIDKGEFVEYYHLREAENEIIKSSDIEWTLDVKDGFDSFKHFISNENTFNHYGVRPVDEILYPVEIKVTDSETVGFVHTKQSSMVETEKVSSFIVDSIFEDKKLSMEDKISKMKAVLNQWMQVGKQQNEVIDSVCKSVTDLCESKGAIIGKDFINETNVANVLTDCVALNKRDLDYIRQSVKSCYDDVCKTLDIPYNMSSNIMFADLISLTRYCQINKKTIISNLIGTYYQPQYPNSLNPIYMYPNMSKGRN